MEEDDFAAEYDDDDIWPRDSESEFRVALAMTWPNFADMTEEEFYDWWEADQSCIE